MLRIPTTSSLTCTKISTPSPPSSQYVLSNAVPVGLSLMEIAGARKPQNARYECFAHSCERCTSMDPLPLIPHRNGCVDHRSVVARAIATEFG